MTEILIETGKGYSKSDHDFQNILWVLRAREKNSKRGLDKVMVNDGTVVCTDGKRIHLAYLDYRDIPNGVYVVAKTTKSQIVLKKSDGDYPDVWSTIMGFKFSRVKRNLFFTSDPSRFIFEVYKKTDTVFSYEFLRDAYMDDSLMDLDIADMSNGKGKVLAIADTERLRFGVVASFLNAGGVTCA